MKNLSPWASDAVEHWRKYRPEVYAQLFANGELYDRAEKAAEQVLIGKDRWLPLGRISEPGAAPMCPFSPWHQNCAKIGRAAPATMSRSSIMVSLLSDLWRLSSVHPLLSTTVAA